MSPDRYNLAGRNACQRESKDRSQNHASTMALLWERCVPRVTDCPVYCQSVQAYLSPGTHVLFGVKESGEMVQKVGTIIGTTRKEEGSSLEINVLDPLAGSGLSIPALTDVTTHNIVEVVQTQVCVWINPDLVRNIAFVFIESILTEDHTTNGCQGIVNVFLIRFRNDQSRVDPSMKPFSCSHDEYYASDCYALRQFLFLDRLRTAFTKLLGRYSMLQGDFVRNDISITMLPENWKYLLLNVGVCAQYMHLTTKKRSIRVLEQGMLLKAVRASYDCELLRLETKDDLDVLCKGLVGDMSLYEVRKRKPAVISPEKLQENDSLNVIIGSDYREEQFVRRTSEGGVDFLYDKVQTLRIFVRYRRYQYRVSTETQMPINCPDEKLARIIERLPSNVNATESEDQAARVVVYGSEFEYDEAVFRVKIVDKAARTALCISVDEGSVEATFNFRHIAPLIIERMQ
jgi:hypothetical protein